MVMKKTLQALILAFLALVTASCERQAGVEEVKPIHLDDIHFIVTDEDEAVSFFQDHFGAREMAHPGNRFDLVRFLSVKWQDPTITITRIGPYEDLPDDRNQRWIDAKIVKPEAEKANPVYGARWLALATPSLAEARAALLAGGVEISEDQVNLPMEPDAKAFSVLGPDGAEIVIVERPERDFEGAQYAIDHIQFLTKDVDVSKVFFTKVYAAETDKVEEHSLSLKVADANLIFSRPEAFGFDPAQIGERETKGAIRIGLDHLGFLYKDIGKAAASAKAKGIAPIFEPQRYIYKDNPTVYMFTAFKSPDSINIEMVQADGRIGPHSYYVDQNNPR
ncbi:MAG: hypothetical protein Pars2KO_15960 [Parasphingorhabdus sp.]